MNPTSVGNLKDPSTWPKPKESMKAETVETKAEEKGDNPYGDYDESITNTELVDTSQNEMIHQPFLMDSEKLVRDVLLEAGMNIKSFVRYEVGQNSE